MPMVSVQVRSCHLMDYLFVCLIVWLFVRLLDCLFACLETDEELQNILDNYEHEVEMRRRRQKTVRALPACLANNPELDSVLTVPYRTSNLITCCLRAAQVSRS